MRKQFRPALLAAVATAAALVPMIASGSASANVAPPSVTSVSPSSGSDTGGTSVVIDGADFADATAVNFGGTAASSFTVQSDAVIDAIAPAHALGAVDITVTTQGGTSATAPADVFTYVVVPPTYTPQTPTRVLDTVTGVGTPSHRIAPVGAGAVLTFTVPNLPVGSTGVMLNLTATHLSGAATTYVSACPAAQPKASCIATSALNVVAGRDISNEITVPVAANGKIQLYNNVGSVNLIADVTGYMNGYYTPVTPTRVLDTRNGTGVAKAPVGPGGLITLTVPNLSENTSGVLLNLTATHLTGAGVTYVSACPDDEPKANCSETSVLNVVAGRDISNEITVPLNGDGKVEFYNNAGSVSLIADLVGTVTDDGYAPIGPVRVLDTRTGLNIGSTSAPVGPGQVLTLTMPPNMPIGITGVNINLTATHLTGAGVTYVSACPGDETKANCSMTSVLNVQAGTDISNEITIPITDGGSVKFYNNAGAVDLVADLDGFYGAAPPPAP